MLHEYKITYSLTDEQEAALVALAARYNRILRTGITAEGLLSSLLLTGSAHVIDERLTGLRAALDAAEAKEGEHR